MSNDQQLCLQAAKDLEHEIAAGVLAISLDSLETFEESLWKQQVLCATLQRHFESFSIRGTLPSDLPYLVGALSDLQNVNRAYDALVQQSRSSADLLLRLCLGYRDTINDVPNRDAALFALEV